MHLLTLKLEKNILILKIRGTTAKWIIGEKRGVKDEKKN